MAFADVMAADAATAMANEAGVSLTWHSIGAADRTRNGSFLEFQGDERIDDSGRWHVRLAEAYVQTSATLGIATVVATDEFTVLGERWAVTGFSREGAMWKVACQRSTQRERAAGPIMQPRS